MLPYTIYSPDKSNNTKNGKTVFSKAYGLTILEYLVPNTSGTIFIIASVSKQFTVMGIVLLHQQEGPAFKRAVEYWGYEGSGNMQSTTNDLLRWLDNFSNPLLGWEAQFTMMQTLDNLNSGEANNYALGAARSSNPVKTIKLSNKALAAYEGYEVGFYSLAVFHE